MPSFHLRSYDLAAPRGRRPTHDADFQDTEANPEVGHDEHNVWRHSSLDLERGLDVSEVPLDTVSGELLDGLLPPPRKPG